MELCAGLIPNSAKCLYFQKIVCVAVFIVLTSSQIYAVTSGRINFSSLGIWFTLNYFFCMISHYLEIALIALLIKAVRRKSLYLLRVWYITRNTIFSLDVLISNTHAQFVFGKLEPQPPISPIMPTTIYWIWGWWVFLIIDMICLIYHINECEPGTGKSWTLCQNVNIGNLIYTQLLFYFVPMLTYIYVHGKQFVDAFFKPEDERPGTTLMFMYASKMILLLLLIPLAFLIYRGITQRDISRVVRFYVYDYILIYPMVLMVNIRAFLEGTDIDNSLVTYLIEMVYYFIQYQILNFLLIELVIQLKLPTPILTKFHISESTFEENHKMDRNLMNENQAFFRSIQINPIDLKVCAGPELGRGQFGRVHKGVLLKAQTLRQKMLWCWHNRVLQELVAIKMLNSVKDENDLDGAILRELKILRKTGYHHRLVKFIGCCIWKTKGFREIGIIFEYCALGSLMDYLKSQKADNLDSEELHRFSKQTAEAMVYLSERKIVHTDLATRNILLDRDKNIKLSDFGMSIQLYYYQLYSSSNAEAFPWRSMSPESLTDLKFSTKTDVWSFGVVLWEIWSGGRTPYENWAWCSDFVQEIFNGLRLHRPAKANEQMYQILKHCWQLDPAHRPDFQEILMSLNALSYRY